MLKFYNNKFIFVVLSILLIAILFLKRDYLYNFHYYHLIKNIVTNDISLNKFYDQFPKGKIQSDSSVLNKNYDSLKLRWFFRPSYISPVYPYVLLNDINKDGIKEVYYASNTEHIYELSSNNGEILRKYKIPFGVFSVKSNLIYEHNNETYFLGITGQSLPVTVLSLDLNGDIIKKNWKKFISGQFVEASINKIIQDNKKSFLISTRDSTFSRGSNNLISVEGNIIFKSNEIVDICNLRPSIANDNSYIIGSHAYIPHELAHHITKKSLVNGDTIWKRKFNHDTGFTTPIIHNNEDNKNYSIYLNDDQNNVIVLDGKTGNIKNTLNDIQIDAVTSNYIISNKLEENGSYVNFIDLNNLDLKFTLEHSKNKNEAINEKYFIIDNQYEIEYHGFSFDKDDETLNYKIYTNEILIQNTRIPLDFINFNKEKYKHSTRDFFGISKIGDVDNDGKLDIFIRIYDYVLLFESSIKKDINYDFEVHPLLTQDAYIFN